MIVVGTTDWKQTFLFRWWINVILSAGLCGGCCCNPLFKSDPAAGTLLSTCCLDMLKRFALAHTS